MTLLPQVFLNFRPIPIVVIPKVSFLIARAAVGRKAASLRNTRADQNLQAYADLPTLTLVNGHVLDASMDIPKTTLHIQEFVDNANILIFVVPELHVVVVQSVMVPYLLQETPRSAIPFRMI